MQDGKVKNGGLTKAAVAQSDDTGIVGFDLAAAVASMGLVVLAALVWMNSASAAIPKQGSDSLSWKSGAAATQCEDKLSSLYLAGSFVMPGSAAQMNIWVGKPRGETEETEVWGMIGKASGNNCEAQCKVTRFERYKKDMKPALMELDCEGSTIKTMRMPLHIQWARGDNNKFDTTVRLGSSIYGVEEAALHVQVNRYAVATAKQ